MKLTISLKPPLRPDLGKPSASARLYRSRVGAFYAPIEALKLEEVLMNTPVYITLTLWVMGEELEEILERQMLLGNPGNH